MRKTGTKHHLDGLLALLLFGVFAASILSVLLTGAGVYSRLTQRDQRAYDRRTCVQYLATKVRQAPSGAQVTVGTFGEGDALLLSEDIDGQPYLTRIYCYDGWLRELFSAADDPFAPEDGEKILPAQALALHTDHNLLQIDLTDSSGQTISLTLSPRGGEEART